MPRKNPRPLARKRLAKLRERMDAAKAGKPAPRRVGMIAHVPLGGADLAIAIAASRLFGAWRA